MQITKTFTNNTKTLQYVNSKKKKTKIKKKTKGHRNFNHKNKTKVINRISFNLWANIKCFIIIINQKNKNTTIKWCMKMQYMKNKISNPDMTATDTQWTRRHKNYQRKTMDTNRQVDQDKSKFLNNGFMKDERAQVTLNIIDCPISSLTLIIYIR